MSRCNVGVFDSPYLATVAAENAFIEGVSESGSKLARLAAGQTMKPVYDHLVSAEAWSPGLFSETAFVQLDEVVSAARSDASFSDEIDKHLLSRLSGDYRTFLTIDGRATRPDLEATRHQAAILENGGLGVQLLGIGVNGHVGFNEPGCEPDSRCRVTELAKSRLELNGYAPRHARSHPWHCRDHIRAADHHGGHRCGQITRYRGHDRRITVDRLPSQPSSGISRFGAVS